MNISIINPNQDSHPIEIILNNNEMKIVKKAKNFNFEIPKLDNRFFYDDEGYIISEHKVKKGYFKNNKWKARVDSNGVKEEKNPTNLDVVCKAIEDAVNKALTDHKAMNE